MKKIDTSNIAGSVKAPYLKATFDHYNEAIQETLDMLVKGNLNYTTGDVIILWGCVITATIPGVSSVTAGAIYYNGEVFAVDANASITTTGSEVLVWNIATTYAVGDPVLYSDGNTYSQHQIRKFVLQAGLTGTGVKDYNATLPYKGFTKGLSINASSNLTGPSVVTASTLRRNGRRLIGNIRVVGTTSANTGFSWTLNSISKYIGKQTVGTVIVTGTMTRYNATDNITDVFLATDDFCSVTIDATGKIAIAFGADISIGASKIVEVVVQFETELL